MDFSVPDAGAHVPVLREEVIKLLDPKPGQTVVDGTLGSGGHALEILKRIGSEGRLIGIDQDPAAIGRAKRNLEAFPQVSFFQNNFTEIDSILQSLNLTAVDAVIMDVGLSSDQLADSSRGFSFQTEGPLDMRMDPDRTVTAEDLVNQLSVEELTMLFKRYGEERWSRRIAGAIERERLKTPIRTTGELVQIIEKAVPKRFHFSRLHPATRVFQALRIAVNQELESLEAALPKAFGVLRPGGRLGVISFHSLEDRLAKQAFRQWRDEGRAKILTPKPVQAGEEERERNSRARSAKLRVIEKREDGEIS
jgi:16S rRNA (cytosine1402-N4)-methyltransferase